MANFITIFRLLLIPIFIFILYSKYSAMAFAVFVLASLTDTLDGIVARHLGKVTELGKKLDPLVDRLLVTAATLSLTLLKILPLWAFLTILIRDFTMIAGYIWLSSKKLSSPEITVAGKISSALLLTSIALFILRLNLAFWFLYPGIALSLISGLDYINKGNDKIKELKSLTLSNLQKL